MNTQPGWAVKGPGGQAKEEDAAKSEQVARPGGEGG